MGQEYRITRGGTRLPDLEAVSNLADRSDRPDFTIVSESSSSIYYVAHIWTDKSRIAFSQLILYLLSISESVTVTEL